MQNTSNNQAGFSIVEGVIAIVVIAVLGFIGWTVYNNYSSKPTTKVSSQTSTSNNSGSNTGSQQTTTPPPTSTNSVTDYFAPANVSFTHDKKWTWDTTGETYSYYEHPNEKTAKLTLPYQGTNDTVPSSYTIDFISDSIAPPSEPFVSITKLGQATLGNQTLYILHAYYSNQSASSNTDTIFTSGCPDKQCSFTPTGSTLYFSVSVNKGTQNAVPLDSSMIPEITSILTSMQLGKQ